MYCSRVWVGGDIHFSRFLPYFHSFFYLDPLLAIYLYRSYRSLIFPLIIQKALYSPQTNFPLFSFMIIIDYLAFLPYSCCWLAIE